MSKNFPPGTRVIIRQYGVGTMVDTANLPIPVAQPGNLSPHRETLFLADDISLVPKRYTLYPYVIVSESELELAQEGPIDLGEYEGEW